MRLKYCCDAKVYENYYLSQVGHGMPYFAGVQVQQGYGLGNLFSSIAKSVLPLVKKGTNILGKQVLQSGVEFASDVLQGKNVKQAAESKEIDLMGKLHIGLTFQNCYLLNGVEVCLRLI